ncbi:glycosyltransferase family 4 protein [Magnetospira thiophila]
MSWTFLAPFLVIIFTASTLAVGLLVRLLRQREILDHPNHRSSHDHPTPRGGGLAVIGVLLIAWVGVGWSFPPLPGGWILPGAALALALLSWADDLWGLSAPLRLGIHLLAVVGALLLWAPALGMAALLGAALFWVWFINLYNFMDGIDGITGVETASLGGGIALVAALSADLEPTLIPLGLSALAAALGFLVWNRPPAKIFLGDVGSVPLGFLLGGLLLTLAAEGAWAAALILPAYYLTDATLTIGKRMLRGDNILQAHREHYYQLGVRSGLSHGAVSGLVLLVNLLLTALAVISLSHPGVALAGAGLVSGVALIYLHRRFLHSQRAVP